MSCCVNTDVSTLIAGGDATTKGAAKLPTRAPSTGPLQNDNSEEGESIEAELREPKVRFVWIGWMTGAQAGCALRAADFGPRDKPRLAREALPGWPAPASSESHPVGSRRRN